jgi:hypothetical protein
VVVSSLVHPAVKLRDLLLQQHLLDGLQIAESLVVTTEKLVQFVHMAHVILLLEGNIDNCLRDFLADAIEEFGFSNDNLEVR